jgi:hypothetical protein
MPVFENNLLLRDGRSRTDQIAIVNGINAQWWFHKLLGLVYTVNLPVANTNSTLRTRPGPNDAEVLSQTPQPQPHLNRISFN